MTDHFPTLIERLQDAEYLHVLLETMPVYGILGGILVLLVAILLRDRRFQSLALAVILVSSLASYPQLKNRRLAESHMLEVRTVEVGNRITAQTELRASMQWAYIALAIACVLSLLTRKAVIGQLVLWFTLAGGMAVVFLTIWLHMRDAEILHPNIELDPGTGAEVIPRGLPRIPR